MLDTFLEHRIQKKLQLYNILQLYGPIDIKIIAETLESTVAFVKDLINDLSLSFSGLAEIQKISSLTPS